jgi:hypothetical protein
MARPLSVLVVAHATASSPQLLEALVARAEPGSLHVTLLLPAQRIGFAAKEEARATLDEALAQYREHGLEAEGVVGDSDPMVAVAELWDPLRFDEIIVSTLPGSVSRWLQADLPHRIGRLTDAQVTHVLSSTPQAPISWEQAPPKERSSLGPLSVLAWGRPKDETDAERERRLRARGRAGTP